MSATATTELAIPDSRIAGVVDLGDSTSRPR